jgi:hypothetical protein
MTYFLISWAQKAWVWLVAAIGLLAGVITDLRRSWVKEVRKAASVTAGFLGVTCWLMLHVGRRGGERWGGVAMRVGLMGGLVMVVRERLVYFF